MEERQIEQVIANLEQQRDQALINLGAINGRLAVLRELRDMALQHAAPAPVPSED